MQLSPSVVSKLQATLPVLAGVGLFAGIVTASIAQRAQCAPPDPSGCVLEFGEVESQSFRDPSIWHAWTINVTQQMDFTVLLSGSSTNLDVELYGPDETLLASSRNPDIANEVIDMPAAAPGTYTVWIQSADGVATELPYVIIARRGLTNTAAATEPVVNPYDIPSTTGGAEINAYEVP